MSGQATTVNLQGITNHGFKSVVRFQMVPGDFTFSVEVETPGENHTALDVTTQAWKEIEAILRQWVAAAERKRENDRTHLFVGPKVV